MYVESLWFVFWLALISIFLWLFLWAFRLPLSVLRAFYLLTRALSRLHFYTMFLFCFVFIYVNIVAAFFLISFLFLKALLMAMDELERAMLDPRVNPACSSRIFLHMMPELYAVPKEVVAEWKKVSPESAVCCRLL